MATLPDCQLSLFSAFATGTLQDKNKKSQGLLYKVTWARSETICSCRWGGIWRSQGGLSCNICLFLAFTEWPSFSFQVLRVQWGLCRQRQTVPRDPHCPLYLPLDLSKGGSSQPWEPRGPHGQFTVWVLCGADRDIKGVTAKSHWTSFLLFL